MLADSPAAHEPRARTDVVDIRLAAQRSAAAVEEAIEALERVVREGRYFLAERELRAFRVEVVQAIADYDPRAHEANQHPH
jgi:hypothetical protein